MNTDVLWCLRAELIKLFKLRRVKGKQVKDLYELVTVSGERRPEKPLGNREGGRKRGSVSQETCLCGYGDAMRIPSHEILAVRCKKAS